MGEIKLFLFADDVTMKKMPKDSRKKIPRVSAFSKVTGHKINITRKNFYILTMNMWTPK